MARVGIITGDTGTGKTRSLKNLPPAESLVVNVLNKPLPFKGSESLFSIKAGNLLVATKPAEIINAIRNVPATVKYLVVDDAGFIMQEEFMDRAREKGYEKFTEVGLHMKQIITACREARPDLCIALMFHDEDDSSDTTKTNKKLKLIGKMLDDKYNPLATVSVVLWTDVKLDQGKREYAFITNRLKLDGVLIPAKSPEGMFESDRIPNDLYEVFKKMDEYYRE